MTCLYGECDKKDSCYNCPTIVSVNVPTVVNVGVAFDIIVNIKSNATLLGDDIDVCLYEGRIPDATMSTGKLTLKPGWSVDVTFPRIATMVGTLFYNVSAIMQDLRLTCADFRKFEVKVTTPVKRYSCINNACQEKEGGDYNEPTCAGKCLPPEIRYDCVGGYCTKKDGGLYTTPNCDGKCLPQRRYRCTDEGNCIEDPYGSFSDPNCLGECKPIADSHNICKDNICTRVDGPGLNECHPTYSQCEKCFIPIPFLPEVCLIKEKDKMIAMIIVGVILLIVLLK